MAPCCDYVGQSGAGHYVKMVHNGIEYGDMQLICEVTLAYLTHKSMIRPGLSYVAYLLCSSLWQAFSILQNVVGMSHDEMAATFLEWNKVLHANTRLPTRKSLLHP